MLKLALGAVALLYAVALICYALGQLVILILP